MKQQQSNDENDPFSHRRMDIICISEQGAQQSSLKICLNNEDQAKQFSKIALFCDTLPINPL